VASYDAIELIPAPNDYFDRDGPATPTGPSPPSTSTVLTIVSMQRAALYEQQLAEGYRQIRFGGNPRATEHPQSTVHLQGQQYTIVYDSTLEGQLLQIYAYLGWPGIEAAEQSMTAASRSSTTGRLHPWKVVKSFFDFTRNRLALRIQDALVEIEAACADRVVSQLSHAATVVDNDWTKLRFEETEISPDGKREAMIQPSLDTNVRTYKKFWRAGNRKLASDLFTAVTRAVQAQEDLRIQQATRDRLQSAVENYDDGRTPTGTTEQLNDTNRAIEESLPAIEELYEDVGQLVPLATLIIPVLTIPFNQALMEHQLGTALNFAMRANGWPRGSTKGEATCARCSVPGMAQCRSNPTCLMRDRSRPV
jgi:hypothetical protein